MIDALLVVKENHAKKYSQEKWSEKKICFLVCIYLTINKNENAFIIITNMIKYISKLLQI